VRKSFLKTGFKNVFKTLLLGAILCASTQFLNAQTPDDDEEEGLYPEGFTFESDLIGNVSRGWFPKPTAGQALVFDGYDSEGWVTFFVERAPAIRSSSFKNTKYGFHHRDPFENNEEREFIEPGESERIDDFPERRTEQYGLTYLLNMPFPAIFRGGLALNVNTGMLFAPDESRQYLDLAGNRQTLKEVNVLAVKEWLLKGSVGLQIPVYGVFMGTSEWGGLGSYYYVYGGISGSYAVSSSATQYSQIANAKESLRYANGRDTVQFMEDVRMSGISPFRYAYEGAVGWNFSAGPVMFALEAFALLPQNSILKDAEWRQYTAGARFMIGYTWQ
jgi:hypothetical protein